MQLLIFFLLLLASFVNLFYQQWIVNLLKEMIKMDAQTQASIDKLNAETARQTTIEASVETLLTGLVKLINDLKVGQTDPAVIAAIDAAAAIVKSDNDKLEAVVANTPTT